MIINHLRQGVEMSGMITSEMMRMAMTPPLRLRNTIGKAYMFITG